MSILNFAMMNANLNSVILESRYHSIDADIVCIWFWYHQPSGIKSGRSLSS